MILLHDDVVVGTVVLNTAFLNVLTWRWGLDVVAIPFCNRHVVWCRIGSPEVQCTSGGVFDVIVVSSQRSLLSRRTIAAG